MDKAEKELLRALLRRLRERQLLSPELFHRAVELVDGAEKVTPHFLQPWGEDRADPEDEG